MRLPPIELLNSVHSFPGPYTFKIISVNDEVVLKNIAIEIQSTLNFKSLPQYSCRISESGKHASLTVEIVLRQAQEVHLVYEALMKTPGVLLLL